MTGAGTTEVAITREGIIERLALAPAMESLFTGDDLERQKAPAAQPYKPAAVLVLVVNHPRPTVVFTQRTAHLADHAGQVSFPGGRCEDADCDAVRTALREAEEEIGVDASRVEVLGRLPEYRTSTGFTVSPVVGWIEPPVEWRPDPHEVDAVFEVPLDFLLDTANHRYESAFYRGRMRQYWAMPYGDRFIWGATASMVVTFCRILGRG